MKEKKELPVVNVKYITLGILLLSFIFTGLSLYAQIALGFLIYMVVIRESVEIHFALGIMIPAFIGIVFYSLLFITPKESLETSLLIIGANMVAFLIGLAPTLFKKLKKFEGNSKA